MVDSVLSDYERAPISAKERALFAFVEIAATTPRALTADDVERVLGAGWSNNALYDAITVCALFKFFNTWVDAAGIAELTADGYAESGHRLATCGYAMSAAAPPEVPA